MAGSLDDQREAASEATRSGQAPEGEGHSHAATPAHDLVFVAGDFEALPGSLHPYHGHIGQADLVCGGEDRHLGRSQILGPANQGRPAPLGTGPPAPRCNHSAARGPVTPTDCAGP